MSTTEDTGWVAITHPSELTANELVRVRLAPIILEVDAVMENYIALSDDEGNTSFRLKWNTGSDTWEETTHEFIIEVPRPRDIREVRELVANPAAVSNRKLRGLDPYGNTFEIAFEGSVGFNVYPSETVTISGVGDVLGDVFYIKDGINGTLEVV